MKPLFLFFSIVSVLLSNSTDTSLLKLQHQAISKKLHQSNYWKKLLHINKNSTISEIKNKTFFLSNTNDNPKDELLKTIEYFYQDKALKTGESAICKYGARFEFLDKKIGLSKYVAYPKCDKKNEFMKKLDARSISIVFSSAYLNSPSSQAGHTFLKINNSFSDVDSYTINYGAIYSPDDNPLMYIYNGLFGGYNGTFAMIKYSEKIQEYIGAEQRDLYQYKFNFTKDELNTILLHLYEIYDTPKPYMFLNKNCSYQILWLIQIARENLFLTEEFSFEVVPIETLKLLNNEGLISLENFRVSLQDKINFTYSNVLNDLEKELLVSNNFIQEYKDKEKLVENKADLLDIKILFLRYKYLRGELSKEKYIKNYIPILRLRSKVDKKSKEHNIKPENILNVHKIRNLKLGVNKIADKYGMQISYKSAYHNKMDYESNLDNGYIDYFGFDYIINENNSYLKKLNILDIKSYAKSTNLFPKISWNIQVSYDELFYEYDDKEVNLKLGVGKSFEIENSLKFYLMASPFMSLSKTQQRAYQMELGLIYINNLFKFGFEYDYRKEDKYYDIFNSFLTIPLKDQNHAINFVYAKTKKESYSILYNYYF